MNDRYADFARIANRSRIVGIATGLFVALGFVAIALLDSGLVTQVGAALIAVTGVWISLRARAQGVYPATLPPGACFETLVSERADLIEREGRSGLIVLVVAMAIYGVGAGGAAWVLLAGAAACWNEPAREANELRQLAEV